jgi:hypothetical protein
MQEYEDHLKEITKLSIATEVPFSQIIEAISVIVSAVISLLKLISKK